MTRTVTRRNLVRVAAAVGTLGVAGCLGDEGESEWALETPLSVSTARQYSAPGCSCCGRYASYLRENIDGDLVESTPDDVAAVKREFGVPGTLQSCHTLVVDGYVVEGHVPATVIARLLDEDPAFDGIALPGMPAGSPGMAGAKRKEFVVYVLDDGSSGEVYERI